MFVSIVNGVNLHVPSSKVHVHADSHSPAAMAAAMMHSGPVCGYKCISQNAQQSPAAS